MTHDEFIDTVQEHASLDDRDEASELVSAVLRTFSELLYRTERDKLGTQLAKPLSKLLHAAKRQNNRRETDRFSAEEFLNRIEARTDMNLSREEAQRYASSVFEVLAQATGKNPLSDIVDALPQDYVSLFSFPEDTEAQGSSSA